MNSDSGEDMMVDDWLTAKQDLSDTSDEELNDDLLCSDEEKETMRYHEPKLQAIAKPFLVCRTSHLSKDTHAKEEQTEIEVDPGEVLDIEINAPSGDEFQSGAELRGGLCPHHIYSSCRGQPALEKTLTGPCCSPEPRFPGQHMLDQQHPASVLDTNLLLTGQTPKGFLQPSGYESDPWRPSPALQGPVSPSKSGRPQPAQDPLRNYPSPRTVPHSGTDASGPRSQKPAVLVRAVARLGSSAKPMAVARGMPITAKQPTSAKSTISAKTPPAQGTVGRNAGQKVKEEPQTPPALQKLPVKPPNIKNNEESGGGDDDGELYRQRLMEQIQQRKEILRHKEQRRRMQALNKKQLLPKCLQRCSKNNQHQQKTTPHVQHTNSRSRFRNVTRLPSSHSQTRCSVLNCYSECQPVRQQHQYHVSVATSQAPAEELQDSRPHQTRADRVVFPDHRSLHCSPKWASQVQEAGKRMLEMVDCDMPVPTKIRVVKHFNTSDTKQSISSNFTPQKCKEFGTVIKTEPRVVTFTTPDSTLQHGPKLLCPNHRRVSIPNQSQHKVVVQGRSRVEKCQMGSTHLVPGKQTRRGGGRMGRAADPVSIEGLSSSTAGVHLKNLLMSVRLVQVAVGGNERYSFISLSSGLKAESVAAQSDVNFIVRLNH